MYDSQLWRLQILCQQVDSEFDESPLLIGCTFSMTLCSLEGLLVSFSHFHEGINHRHEDLLLPTKPHFHISTLRTWFQM